MIKKTGFIFLFILMMITLNVFSQVKEDVVSEEKPKKKFESYYIGEYRFKERNNWFTFGFGPNLYPSIKNFNNANMSVDFHYFDKKDRLWHAGYQAHTQEYLLLGGASIYLHSLKYGRGFARVEKQYWKMAAFAGPSIEYTRYYPTDTTKTISGQRTFGVGVQAQAEFVFKPVYDFGIAIIPFVNINTIQTVAGITIAVYGSNAMVKKIR